MIIALTFNAEMMSVFTKCHQLQGGCATLTPYPEALPLDPTEGSALRLPIRVYFRLPRKGVELRAALYQNA